MGKKLKWTPPQDAVEVAQETTWSPPADAVEVKKNDGGVSQQQGGASSTWDEPKKAGFLEALSKSAKNIWKNAGPTSEIAIDLNDMPLDYNEYVEKQGTYDKTLPSVYQSNPIPYKETFANKTLDEIKEQYGNSVITNAEPGSSTDKNGERIAISVADLIDQIPKNQRTKGDDFNSFQNLVNDALKQVRVHQYNRKDALSKQSQELMKDVPQTWDESSGNKPGYVGGALGQAVASSGAAIALPGYGGYMLTKGEILDEATREMAEAKGMSEREFVESGGKFNSNAAIELGSIISAGLEYTGIGKLGAPLFKKLAKEGLKAAIKKGALDVATSAGTEAVTEFGQSIVEQVSAQKAAGKSFDSEDEEKQIKIDWDQAIESLRQGAIGGGGISVATNTISNLKNGVNRRGDDGTGAPATETTGEPVQQNAEGQGQPGTQEAVQQGADQSLQPNTEIPATVLEENTNLQSNEKAETQPDPVPPGSEQERGGIKQEDAESITRRVQEASPTIKGAQRSEREVKKEQDRELESYARENGSFIEDVQETFGEKLDGGTEQDVYLNKEGDKVIKVNGLANHSSWSEFWDRLNLQNELFPNTGYNLIGFTKVGGRLSAVSEQPYIDGEPVPRQELIEDLANRGFYQIHPEGSPGENQFYNSELGIRLTDVHGENVKKDQDGNIRYIDPMLDREDPFVDEESKKHFYEARKGFHAKNSDLAVGNYVKKDGSWFLINRNGELERVLDLNKPVNEYKGNERTEIEALKRISDELESGPIDEKIDQPERDRIKNLDRVTLLSRVRGYFLDGGKIKWNEERDASGRKTSKGVREDTGYKEGERKNLIGIQSKTGLNAEQIGEKLWQEYGEDFSDQDYKDAVLDVLSTDRSRWFADQREELDLDANIDREHREYERGQIQERIAELETQEKQTYEDTKGLYENERRVRSTAEAGGPSTGSEVPRGSNQSGQPDAAARIRENGDEVKSKQAREELANLKLTHVSGLGMGQNQAKGKYVSTEENNRYATENNPAQEVKADIQNPFVTDSHTFAAIQREAIQQRFNKNSVDDLTESEADLLAEMMTDFFHKEGYDSIYFPESDTQEGEVIVFDRNKVSDGGSIPNQSERPASESGGEGQSVPPPTAEEPPGEGVDNPPGEEQRTIAKRYLNDPDVADEVKSGLSNEGRNYIPTTNLKRQAEADAYIEEKGVDQAMDDITDPNNGMSDDNRVFIGKTLYKMLKDEVKTSENPDAIRDKINRLVEDVAKMGTKAGQTVQAFSNMFASDAEQVAHALKKEYKNTQKQALEHHAPQLQNLQSMIERATEDALRGLLSDPRIQKLIEESRLASKTRMSKRKQFTARVLSKLDELEKQIDDNLKSGKLNADITFGLLPIAYKAAINTIRLAVKAGDSLLDAVEKAVNEINQNKQEWDEKAFREQFAADIKAEQKADRKTILEALSVTGDKFKSLAEAHYKKYASSKQEFSRVLEDEFGLEAWESSRLSKLLDKIVGEKRQKLIEQKFASKLSTPKAKRVAKQMADKIKEFTDMGVMSDKNLREAYLESIGLPAISDEQARELERMVEVAEAKPEGWQRYEAVQDMIKYHQKITPVSWLSVAESIWYANMLSGISTHKVNFEANAVRTLNEMFVSVIEGFIQFKNPSAAIRNWGFMLKGLVEGYNRNLKESANVLKNGYIPVKGKFDTDSFTGVKTSKASTLEILARTNPLSYWKYVGRLLAASDILFYGGLKHMRAHQMAFREAYNQVKNTTDKDVIKKANEILSRTNTQLDAAKLRAESEGLKGRDYQRRVFEIMEQSWSESIRDDANTFAAKGTYNYDPEGMLGVMTGVVNNATNKLPLLRTVVPFTRVIANVTNDYLDYTPWGLVRAAKGGMGIPNKPSFKKFTDEELLREKIKAFMGTAAMVTLYAMSQSDDGEEPFLEITADGTGNFKNNFELGQTGWKEYTAKFNGSSIRFDYRNTPLAIPFAVVGYINDSEKYKNKKLDDNQLGMIFSGTFHFISDLSFLSGLSDFFEILTDEKDIGSKLVKFGERTGKTLVVPNLFTQVSRSIQEITETPMKKGDSFYGQLFRDMPVLRDKLGNMHNTLGEPIVTETLYKFNPMKMSSMADNKEKDSYKLWELIMDTKAYIGAPSKATRIYDPVAEIDREMTPDEYDEYALKSAKYTKEMLLAEYENLITESDKKIVKDIIYRIKEAARGRAKAEMLQ
jgi:hypothetical protein